MVPPSPRSPLLMRQYVKDKYRKRNWNSTILMRYYFCENTSLIKSKLKIDKERNFKNNNVELVS